jgi:hypothetical protein
MGSGMRSVVAIAALAAVMTAPAAAGSEPLRARVKPPEPAFNRLYHNDEIIDFLRGYARAYPRWVRLESLGKTLGGDDTWLLTINNPETGDELTKPAMYVDGAIHANEAQATETVLYLIDYMLKNYGKLDRVTELMDRSVFYFVPIVSPDSRAKWFDEPATPNYPRTVQIAIDDDRDGRKDEDHYDDLNGDNEITQMRKRVPMGQGTHRLHPDDPRIMERVSGDEQGDWIMLGSEGIDNDGDGRINEDVVGYVDPNRTWGYFWQPRYVQSGTTQYPLQIPETRTIAEWLLTRPNIAAGQSFHNTGRMILRGPGAKSEANYPAQDIQVYDYLGEEGERLLPGYNYWVIWEDLYTVYGGTVNHLYGVHGAISFTNELYGPEQDFDGDGRVSQEERMAFNDRLALGRMFVEWEEVEHPQYGTVEVGGFRKDTGRIPEGWMLEEECHRNAAFVLFHAHHMPLLSFGEVETEEAGDGLWRIYAAVRNERAIPSMTAWAAQNDLHRPDVVTVEGAEVVASGTVRDRWMKQYSLQEHRPERLMIDGVDGFETKVLVFLVQGDAGDEVEIVYDSQKGGTIRTGATLGE